MMCKRSKFQALWGVLTDIVQIGEDFLTLHIGWSKNGFTYILPKGHKKKNLCSSLLHIWGKISQFINQYLCTTLRIQGVSEGIVNILGVGSMDYCE